MLVGKLTVFNRFLELKYFPINMALFVQKLWRKKMSKYVSGCFKTKKNSMTSKPRGEGKSLTGRTTKKNLFFLSLREDVKKNITCEGSSSSTYSETSYTW